MKPQPTKHAGKAKYPPHCWTVQQAVAKIEQTFAHPDLRVERFTIEVVTPKGGTLKLKWDRLNVGQPRSLESTL